MKKRIVPIIIFAFSILIFAIGIWQLVLFIPPQLDMLDQATLQGAAEEEISDYYRQQFLPQVLTYVITSIGMAAILSSIGMLYIKLNSKKATNEQYKYQQVQSNHSDEDELDNFFEEFEVVGDERKS